MADDSEIGGLTAASALDGTELVHCVQSGNSRGMTTAQIRTLGLIDEDDFSTDSATKAPSQQSAGAYIETQIATVRRIYSSNIVPASVSAGASWTHGLGAIPTAFGMDFVCTVAHNGWAVGDHHPFHCDPFDYRRTIACNATTTKWLDQGYSYIFHNAFGTGYTDLYSVGFTNWAVRFWVIP